MRRFIYLLLALLAVLTACGSTEGEDSALPSVDKVGLAALMEGVEDYNATLKRRVVCSLSVKEGEDSRYFTQGTFSYDRGTPLGMSGALTQVLEGEAVTEEVYYKAGAYYYSNQGGKYYAVMDGTVVTDSFYCRAVPLIRAEDVVSYRTADSSLGKKHVYGVKDCTFLESLFAEALAEHSGVKRAMKDRTVYEQGELSYIVDEEGRLAAFTASCRAIMVDEPAYYPTGYRRDESERTHGFDLKLELTVKATGDKVYVVLPDTKDYVFLG